MPIPLQEFRNLWEHAQDSPFEGKLKKPTKRILASNSSCGDKIVIEFQIDKKGKITDAKFQHNGCTLSYIATSVLLSRIIGKSLSGIKKIKQNEFLKIFDFPITSARLQCVLLPIQSLHNIKFAKDEIHF